MDEKFSSFLDEECSARETSQQLRRLGRNAALRESLSRQLWLREVLRGESVELDTGFSARLFAAVDAQEQPGGKVVDLQERRERVRRHWLGPMTGFATAASIVAAVVLLGNVSQLGEGDGSQLSPTAPVNTLAATQQQPALPREAGLRQAVAERIERVTRSSDHWAVSDPAIEDRLNGYLLEHNGLARGYGLSSATPSFVRVATYGEGNSR